MELKVLYVDTLFFVNFALDLLSLCLVGVFLHVERRLWRILAAAAIGALYATAAVLWAFLPVLHLFFSVLLSFLLVRVSFGSFGNVRRFLGAVILFYISSVLLGGAVEAMFSLLETLLVGRTDASLRASDLVLLFGFLAFGVLYAASRFFGGLPTKRNVNVRVSFEAKNVTFTVLIDSGCLLCDPISGKPALLVRLDALSSVLPSEIVAAARSKSAYMPRSPQYARRCRLIPAEALGEKRLLLSVRADALELLPEKVGKEKEKRLDAYIALISVERGHFGGCEGLLPSSLLLL